LREARATVELREAREDGGALLRASRRDDEGATDRLEWRGASLAPKPGDRAAYEQGATGLGVDVVVDGIGADPPEPAAFEDPDRAVEGAP
jgi:hypothetical protein